MNTQMLQYAIAIQKHGNMSKAAAALNVTPAGLSQAMARFQLQLGKPIFIMHRGRGDAVKSVEVTEFGKKFLFRAGNTLRSINALEDFAKAG